MGQPIDNGSIVLCVRDEDTYGSLQRGRVYKVEAVCWFGFAVYVMGLPGPYSSERFALKYVFDETDPEPDDEGDYCADH